MNPAPNLVLVGPMGAGKSSLGRRLATRLGLEFVDVDRRLEQLAGASIPLIFELEGEAGFRAREQQLLAELLAGHGQAIATGGGAVLSAATRARLRERSFVVLVQVGIEQQLARLERDHARPLLAQGDRRQTLLALALVRDPLYAEVADHVFASDGLGVDDAARRLTNFLKQHWQSGAAA
ncbi:MAG: shikimate kinase [Arenimonas sp.]